MVVSSTEPRKRIAVVREFLSDGPPFTLQEFASFWRGLTDAEKIEYSNGVAAVTPSLTFCD